MAVTITNAVTPTADSGNNATYPTPSFTPAAGDLLVVFAGISTTVDAGACTASANGLTFTKFDSAVKGTSQHTLYGFIANQLVPESPASMTVTMDVTGDNGTGGIVCVARVSGLILAGLAAIRQSATDDNVLSGTAPAPVFGVAPLTTNPILFGIMTTVNGGATAPTGSPTWTEQVDTNYATPTTGGGYYSVPSGYTSQTVTLGSTTNGACCGITVELDATTVYPKRITEEMHNARPMAAAVGRASSW